MKIHFVCTGNVYRSRLAEAYLKSKKIPNLDVSSSGILAEIDYPYNGPIFWGTMRLMMQHNLIPFMSKMSTQTTLKLLNTADLIIFMKGNHHEFSKKELGFVKKNYEIWEVEDLDDMTGYQTIKDYVDPKVIPETEKTFEIIREKVDKLVEKLRK